MTTRDEQSLSSLVIDLSEDIDKLTKDIKDLNSTYSQSLRRRTIVFIGLIVLIVMMIAVLFTGFMFNRNLTNRISDESIARAATLCEDNNNTRALMIDMLTELFITQDIDSITEEEVEERSRRINLLRESVLRPIDCEERIEN